MGKFTTKKPAKKIVKKRKTLSSKLTLSKTVLPSSRMQDFVYTSDAITAISGIPVQWHNLSLNGMYDPDLTAVGHQYKSFDQWGPFYNRYRVMTIKVIVEGMMTTSGVGVIISGASSQQLPPNTLIDAFEDKAYRTDLVNSDKPFKLVRTYNIPRVLGLTKAQYMGEVAYSALMSGTANPLLTGNIYTGFSNLDSVTASTCIYRVTLIASVRLSDIKVMGAS